MNYRDDAFADAERLPVDDTHSAAQQVRSHTDYQSAVIIIYYLLFICHKTHIIMKYTCKNYKIGRTCILLFCYFSCVFVILETLLLM